MTDTVRLARIAVTVLILIILVFVGCRRSSQSTQTDNSDLQIALEPMPLEETLVVILTDANGAPITDATIALEGNMSHPGMLPVLADPIADDADGSADGRYTLPFAFAMLGDWIVTVTVTQADGSSFTRDLGLHASQDGIKGEMVTPAPESNIESDREDATDTQAALVQIHDPMARPAPLAGGTGAVYFMLHNSGDTPVKLMGADTPAASAVELHTTENDNGVMRMRQITEGVELGAAESIHLTPGAMHLMLVDLAAPLAEGETIEVTLHFDGADDLTVEVPVVAMDELAAEGEEEHNH